MGWLKITNNNSFYVALPLNIGIDARKQRLYWTLPNFGTKEQCDRWSDLMLMMTWELWLACEVIVDCPLPWQKPQIKLTPGRVAQGFGAVIALIGTPTSLPKPRGKSPGRKKGQLRNKRKRYPIVKKGISNTSTV